jgi:hypothetical protein
MCQAVKNFFSSFLLPKGEKKKMRGILCYPAPSPLPSPQRGEGKCLNMRLVIGICILFVIWCLEFGISHYAFASIDVQPIRLELELDAGKTYSDYLTLTNHSEGEIEISVSPGEYRYMFSENTVYPENQNNKAIPSSKGWITFKPDKIMLKKGQPRQIQYAINVPAGAVDEYVACIIIDEEQAEQELNPSITGQVRVKITPRISIPVYIAIKNSLKRSCSIDETSQLVDSKEKNVDFYITLKNDGNVHIRPSTTLVIIDEYGAVAGKLSLGKSLPIFAGFGEKLTATWKAKFFGKYTAVVTVDIGDGQIVQESVKFEVKR